VGILRIRGNAYKTVRTRPIDLHNDTELTENGPIQRLELRKRIIESQDFSWTNEREIPVSVMQTIVRIGHSRKKIILTLDRRKESPLQVMLMLATPLTNV
jgi:hypothetical protein